MGIHIISYVDSELSLVKDIVPFFSPIEICLPWEKELPGIVDEQTITALYPAEDLKPDISFERTLNDCLNWVEEQGEKSRIELIKAGAGKVSSEESLYQIRHLLVSRESEASAVKNITNRWHLLIHLAGRIEEHRSEANQMLNKLNKRPSPLADSLDQTGKTEELLGTPAEVNDDFLLEDAYTSHFLSAWLGLFGDIIKDGRMLLTLNGQIFHKMAEKWDSFCGDEKSREEANLCFKAPLISSLSTEEQKKLKTDDAVKEKCTQLMELICNTDTDPVEKKTALVKNIQEFEKMFPEDMMKSHILFTLLFFYMPSDRESSFKDDSVELLSGKALLLAEKVVM
ncbi:hypothetical protein ACFL1N_09005 [Thermodesulfobacteriota bacterium]